MSSNEIAKQTAVSTIKGAISAIPIVGGALNEYVFEARGRIKQDRFNKFINEFAEYLSQFKDVKLNIEQIEKEEFGDFFEEVVINVSKNHSQIKKEAFRNLLANQLLKPNEVNYAELLLSIIGSLQEKQIPILKTISDAYSSKYSEDKEEFKIQLAELKNKEHHFKEEFKSIGSTAYVHTNDEINKIKERINSVRSDINKLLTKIENTESPFRGRTYNLEQPEFYFLIQDLCNKGLLIDNGIRFKNELYDEIEVSKFGKDLILALSDHASS